MRNIGQDRIRNIIVPICSCGEMDTVIQLIGEKLSLSDSLLQEIDLELEKSDVLRQSILKKAFTGQLVEQDLNDESASALLERIKAEKKEQAKPGKKRKRKTAA